MPSLSDIAEFVDAERGLAIVSTTRADGSIQTSLVNAGVFPDPATGVAGLAFVTYGPIKLANLRARPQIAVAFRSGWRWAGVEGVARLIGPDDPDAGVDPEALRLLLRNVFICASGTHDDWDEYDRVMLEQRRTAVLIAPTRVYGT